MIDPLPITIQTAYAELVEQLVAFEARRSIGHVPGTFVTKEIKGATYVYFQFSAPGGTTKQAYVGRQSKQLAALIKRFAVEKAEAAQDRERIASLTTVLRAGGAAATDAASARVIAALAESGVFRLGGVLVGMHAFIAAGNMLGVRWNKATARTEDIDIAASVL